MSSSSELVRRIAGRTHPAPANSCASSAQEGAMPLVPTAAPSRERDPLTGGRCELAPLVLDGVTVGQGLLGLAGSSSTASPPAPWH